MATPLDEIRAHQRRPGYACSIATWLAQADKKTAATFLAGMQAPDIASSAIASWLKTKDGPSISGNQISHHRRGGCQHCKAVGHDVVKR